MPQQVAPYQLHEASGILHYTSGRYISPYFDQSNGERWYIDFLPCGYHTKIINFWEQEIKIFYVTTASGEKIFTNMSTNLNTKEKRFAL